MRHEGRVGAPNGTWRSVHCGDPAWGTPLPSAHASQRGHGVAQSRPRNGAGRGRGGRGNVIGVKVRIVQFIIHAKKRSDGN